MTGSPYQGYAYSYPHKTAYRALEPPVPLARAWADEPRDGIFVYVHLPFCEMRCGFCNLFTAREGSRESVDVYLRALEHQGEAVRRGRGPPPGGPPARGGRP
ncbi:MAG: coproporphyrinogen III oxidase family protein, partial [Candidatus Eremiobacterota bacterium]